MIALPLADPAAYLDRYSEPDKAGAGLGASTEAWPVPYWTVDTAFAVMTMLLAAEAKGLGALFFGLFRGEAELRAALGLPAQVELLGAIAAGLAGRGGPPWTVRLPAPPPGRGDHPPRAVVALVRCWW